MIARIMHFFATTSGEQVLEFGRGAAVSGVETEKKRFGTEAAAGVIHAGAE